MRQGTLWGKLKRAVCIPPAVRRAFWQETVQKNDLSMRVICGIIFVVELRNVWRVLAVSSVGLGTRNNRIYFGAYCTLLAIAGLWLLLRPVLRRAGTKKQWLGQYTMVCLLFVWHLCLNAYDLYRDPQASVIVLTTAVLGLAFFIQMPPVCGLCNFFVGYGLFQLVVAPRLQAGEVVNLSITFIVAAGVSVTNAHHAFVNLQQREEITQINEKLRELAALDPLTGLLNKTIVQYRVEQHLQRMSKEGGLTFFMMDLDDFKSINDQYGHPCGDAVLMETAGKLHTVFPDAVGLGRIGGDEFAVILGRPLTQSEALAKGDRMIDVLQGISWNGHPLKVQCSMGACTCTQPDTSYQQLYVKADHMLYEAKHAGKGCYRHTCICSKKEENRTDIL